LSKIFHPLAKGNDSQTLIFMGNDMEESLLWAQTAVLMVQTVVLMVSVVLILWKIKKTYDWNRRKASQDACYEFMRHPIAKFWGLIYIPVVIEKKNYFGLNPKQKEAARTIMDYFENLGILIKHSIVDEKIIYDNFQSTWCRFFNASKEYVKSTRLSVGDETVFENFDNYALAFNRLNNDRTQARRKEGVTMNIRKVKLNNRVKGVTPISPLSKQEILIKPTVDDVKAVLGKINLNVVAASVCACGCSCYIDPE